MKHVRLLSYGALLAAAGCTFTSCSDDNEPTTDKVSTLTARDWKMTAGSVTPGIPSGGTTIRDVYAAYPSCRQDDLLHFEKPNVLKELSGPTQCSGDVASKTGTWSFSSDQSQLYLLRQGKSTTDDYSVKQLTSTTMKLETTETNNGVAYTFTYTYTAQ